MATVSVVTAGNDKVEDVELQDSVFNAPIKKDVVHQVVCSQLAARRKGSSATKGRSEVRGGGKKTWRQKGTGNARVGTTRSPLWRGGGVVFGPQPRDYSFRVPRKMRKAAMRSVLTSKVQESKFLVLDRLDFDAPSTKQMLSILKGLIGDLSASVAVALGDWTESAWKSGRNIPGVRVLHAENLNVYVALQHEYLIVDRAGLSIIEGALAQ
ncbi:50S ribosomal protein L4 [candidate division KSB3 bacterium]|uniref:Large ribosomal subunit protein uL4 n=1 Tax=candidate division KSB3 bacterium TaxID=2044937 RepID=A0A2G6E1H7_9BACT|nr:MAG: 50S ribosomal protein L4 [candidate division KSB3 bacterium]PIE28547.1 MAG: 50S ribosomal protein L4 [candidate division KSB3 bacterium]